MSIIRAFSIMKRWASSSLFFFIFFLVIFAASTFFHWIDLSKIISTSLLKTTKNFNPNTQIQLKCFNGSSTPTCPPYFPATFELKNSSAAACPDYFRWIHEDLKPWKSSGISRDMVERGKDTSHFRLVILNGKAYVEKHAEVFQTRDVFTIWGILQLLRLYPGKIPDLELLFECGDRTVVEKTRFQGPASMSVPPPIFHYCGHEDAFDIVFPDWTFWGWAETNIRPWKTILQTIEESNKKIKWKDRVPYAFWKGNTKVSSIREELSKCNASEKHDWNARIYPLHWDKEIKQEFKNTKLENQCTHRYKIYVEGSAWSVSEKYILACDSMTLFIKPEYYDFFSRSMIPLQHYWPISTQNMCNDIKFAVDWGNTQMNRAQVIGKAGSNYIQENLNMQFVYDYMFHLLREYAKLMRFRPRIPSGAVEVCYETVACPMDGPWKEFMEESMVKSPSDTPPCTMPPYKPAVLQEFQHTKQSLIKQVEMRKSEYFRV